MRQAGKRTSPLHKAARSGDLFRLAECISARRRLASHTPENFEEWINYKILGGKTALHLVCSLGQSDCLELLLGMGANPNVVTDDGQTPLVCLLLAAIDATKKEILRFELSLRILVDSPEFDLPMQQALCNPLFFCVPNSTPQGEKMFLLLSRLLSAGFDPNATRGDYSILHLAIKNIQQECVFALVFGGADVYKSAPYCQPNGSNPLCNLNCLEAAKQFLGESHATAMKMFYDASRCVAGPTRRKLLLSKREDHRLVSLTMKVAKNLMKFGHHAQVFAVLLSLGQSPHRAFSSQDRFMRLYYLSGLSFYHRNLDKAMSYIDHLLLEFPQDIMARLHKACLILHPAYEKQSDLDLKYARAIVASTQHQLDNCHVFEFASEDFTQADVLTRLQYLQHRLKVQGKHDLDARLDKIEYECMQEKNGDEHFDQAADFVDNALKEYSMQGLSKEPRLNFLKAAISVTQANTSLQLAYEMIGSYSIGKGDFMEQGSSISVGRKWKHSKEAFAKALQYYELIVAGDSDQNYCDHDAWEREYFKGSAEWGQLEILVSLGQLEKAQTIASSTLAGLLNMRCQHFKYDCMRLNGFRHPGVQSIVHFRENMDSAAQNHDVFVHLLLLSKLHDWIRETEHGEKKPQDCDTDADADKVDHHQVNTEVTLTDLLSNKESLPLISCAQRVAIQVYVGTGELQESAVVRAWESAAHSIQQHKDVLDDMYSKFAKMMIDTNVRPAKQQGCSLRVVGTLLKEALAWDPNVDVPEELLEAKRKMAPPPVCNECCTSYPQHSCPCHTVHYCNRKCQVNDWKKHKQVCPTRQQQRQDKHNSQPPQG